MPVQYAGHQVVLRTWSPDIIVAYCHLHENEFKDLNEISVVGGVNVIIDGGAYAGFSALAFAKMFPECKIIAVEPDPENYELLVRNTANTPNITPVNAALAAEKGRVTLFDPGRHEWGLNTVAQVGAKRAEVPTLTIPDILADFKLKRIDILKLDIEGAEKSIFENSAKWIDSVAVIYVELHDHYVPGAAKAFHQATKGFKQVLINETIAVQGETVCAVNHKFAADL